MKKLNQLLLGAAALAFTGGAQAADLPVKAAAKAETPKVSGVIGSFTGGTWAHNTEGDSTSAWIYGGEARVNWWFAPNWSVQTDLEVEGTGTIHNNSTDWQDGRIMGTVGKHLTWRDPNRGALGIFGGYTMTNLLDAYGSESRTFFGGEGQLYLDKFTLYGQVGGTWFHNASSGASDYVWDSAWFIRGVARYFFTPDDKLQGEVGYASGSRRDGNSDPNVVNWGVLYEHNKFMGTPFSAYIEYAGFRYEDSNNSNNASENIFMVGTRIYFYQDTLLSNDRTGSTFDMPKFMRAQAWAPYIH
jgi:hypothetical protein